MDSVIVSTGEQQGLESDGCMGSWKENLLVPLEFDSMQFFAIYINKIPWNLFSKTGEGEVCGLSALSFFSSLLYEKWFLILW